MIGVARAAEIGEKATSAQVQTLMAVFDRIANHDYRTRVKTDFVAAFGKPAEIEAWNYEAALGWATDAANEEPF